MVNGRSTRPRSLQGCFTCRARKVKCDEIQPICVTCQGAGLLCEGFTPKLRWLFYNPKFNGFDGDVEVDDGGHGRRSLYTDVQRLEMSRATALSANQTNRRLSRVLNDLDLEALRMDTDHFEIGPFRALRLHTRHNSDQPSPKDDQTFWSERIDIPDDSTNNELGSWFSSLDQDLELPNISSSSPIGEVEDGSSALILPEQSFPSPSFSLLAQSLVTVSITSEDLTPTSLPMSTPFLLKHYESNMGNWFSPIRIRKHPWSILHLPIALSTVSELSILGKASHAKITILRALLSLSAFVLDASGYTVGNITDMSPSTYWREVGHQYKEVAKREMKQCFATEIRGNTKAKYKEVLLALLTLISISVVCGQHKEVRSYLLDAERFICIRGILKPVKSRKVKILHHMYLFLRVIEESTHIYPEHEILNSGHDPLKSDLLFPSIQTQSRISGRNLDTLCAANFESELLSQIPNTPSILMEVYGIPLSLFSLISRTTNLANDKDLWTTKFGDQERAKPIKDLEHEICHWDIDESISTERGTDMSPPANDYMMRPLIFAIHNALILYFYRRIYNVNSMILQRYVDNVLDSLQQVEQQKLESNILNTSIIWPGFIAAVEAHGEVRQIKAITWLKHTALQSGWGSFMSAANLAEELWKVQREGNPQTTWVDILRGRGTALILT